MTLKKFAKLYKHYQNDYDFKLKKVSYTEVIEKHNESEEWIPDKYVERR